MSSAEEFEKKKREELNQRKRKLRGLRKIPLNKDLIVSEGATYVEEAEHAMTIETQNEIMIDLLRRIYYDIPECNS